MTSSKRRPLNVEVDGRMYKQIVTHARGDKAFFVEDTRSGNELYVPTYYDQEKKPVYLMGVSLLEGSDILEVECLASGTDEMDIGFGISEKILEESEKDSRIKGMNGFLVIGENGQRACRIDEGTGQKITLAERLSVLFRVCRYEVPSSYKWVGIDL